MAAAAADSTLTDDDIQSFLEPGHLSLSQYGSMQDLSALDQGDGTADASRLPPLAPRAANSTQPSLSASSRLGPVRTASRDRGAEDSGVGGEPDKV